MASLPIAHYADPHFRFGPEFAPDEFLSEKLRKEIVRDMFRFRVRIPLNMQTTVFSRSAASKVLGPLFRPPFPDHYAINAMLLTAESWAHVAHQPIIVGISPKSFGHFVYSNRQEAGLTYLGIDTEFNGRLPGNELLSAMYIWLNLLADEFPDSLGGVEVSRRDYVARQLWAWFVQWRLGTLETGHLLGRLRLLRARDWRDLILLSGNAGMLSQLWSRLRVAKAGKAQRLWAGLKPLPEVTNIAEFATWLQVRSGGG